MKPAAFFDRDGVLNVEKGYLFKTEDFEWQQGAIEAVKLLNEKGYYVFVVTNQSGVARGMYKEEDVQKLHDFMQQQLALQGAKIDAFYYCPHHPEGKVFKYSSFCDCRKPKPGMLFQAIDNHEIDTAESFLIGDKDTDLRAAENAGIKGYLYYSGDLSELVKKIISR